MTRNETTTIETTTINVRARGYKAAGEKAVAIVLEGMDTSWCIAPDGVRPGCIWIENRQYDVHVEREQDKSYTVTFEKVLTEYEQALAFEAEYNDTGVYEPTPADEANEVLTEMGECADYMRETILAGGTIADAVSTVRMKYTDETIALVLVKDIVENRYDPHISQGNNDYASAKEHVVRAILDRADSLRAIARFRHIDVCVAVQPGTFDAFVTEWRSVQATPRPVQPSPEEAHQDKSCTATFEIGLKKCERCAEEIENEELTHEKAMELVNEAFDCSDYAEELLVLGIRLDEAVNRVRIRYSDDVIAMVLVANLRATENSSLISRDNHEWAEGNERSARAVLSATGGKVIWDRFQRFAVFIAVHPGTLDAFVTAWRSAVEGLHPAQPSPEKAYQAVITALNEVQAVRDKIGAMPITPDMPQADVDARNEAYKAACDAFSRACEDVAKAMSAVLEAESTQETRPFAHGFIPDCRALRLNNEHPKIARAAAAQPTEMVEVPA